MHSLRTLLSRNFGPAGFSLVITASLLLLMQHLISEEGSEVEAALTEGNLIFLREIEDQEPDGARDKPEKVDPPVQPPDTNIDQTIDAPGGTGIEVTTPVRWAGIDPVVAQGMPDGDILPITKVSPMYPERARRQGIEGYVVVQFTIDEIGRVVDVRVVEAVPSSIFNRSAVEAVQRFKYKPRVVNGEPTVVTKVMHRLSFELS